MGYVVFAVLLAAVGRSSLKELHGTEIAASDQGAAPAPEVATEAPPTGGRQVLWATLAGTASLLVLAVSNHITQNIAAVPLLWIAPLAALLLTFICASTARLVPPRSVPGDVRRRRGR